jgi:class I fructose-bisphosphate aldolase
MRNDWRSEVNLPAGKRARLRRIFFQHGLGNASGMFLPYDQGLEHGPRDFVDSPWAADPAYAVRLAVEGGFNGVAVQIGVAERFYWEYAGEVPLVLKLNGKTELPPGDAPLSPLNGTVEDAVRLGADAVGYTLYVGSARQDEDFTQLRQVRQDCGRYGMPLIVWAYPRGSAVDARGGRDSFYAVDYAARGAAELGADVVKVNFPDPSARTGVPSAYDRDLSSADAIAAVVRSAGRSLVLLSGGERAPDDEVLARAEEAMAGGATGVIFGRNVWQRDHDEALRFVAALRDVLSRHGVAEGGSQA